MAERIRNPMTGKMVKVHGKIGRKIIKMLNSSKEEVIESLMKHRDWIKYTTEEQRSDPDIILTVTRPDRINTFCTGYFMRYASPELKSNKEFMLRAVENNPKVFEFMALIETLPVPEEKMKEPQFNNRRLHPEIVDAAIEGDPFQSNYVIGN